MSKLEQIFGAVQSVARYVTGYGPCSAERVVYMERYNDGTLNIADDTRTVYAIESRKDGGDRLSLTLALRGNGFEKPSFHAASQSGLVAMPLDCDCKEIDLGNFPREDALALIENFNKGHYLHELIPGVTEQSPLALHLACHEIFKGYCKLDDPTFTTHKPADPVAYLKSYHGEGNAPVPLCALDPL